MTTAYASSSTAPAAALPPPDPARVLTHAVGGNRGAGFLPDAPQGPLKVSGARLCDAVASGRSACMGEKDPGSSPHFAHWRPGTRTGARVALDWKKPGTPARLTPQKPVSSRAREARAARRRTPEHQRTRFDVSVRDAKGKRAVLGSVRIDGLPGTDRTASYWAQELRVPLTAATRAKLNLSKIASLEVTPKSRSGKAWLMDACRGSRARPR
ncbi:hypothetical protein [Streptomyces sp. H-KF8]|uniref:hypothetical protein n=1 Tax=Streptomyces sp. H-KF8 TaxID=1727216 RepID=UPI000AA7F77C|nr:hypothetical protein [Streptomyces sp. H-KF8]